MSEIAFEYLLAAREAVKGTAINPPTHYLNMSGVVTPRREMYRPDEARGTLAEYYRSKIVRKWNEWTAEGVADVYTLPVLLESCIKGAAAIATPGGGTSSRTHTYVPTMTSDDLQSLTLYWGDPNVQAFQSDYCMVDEVTISADASSTDGAMMSVSGQGHFPAKTAPISLPSFLEAPLLAPANMQLWIDSGVDAIGTTPITGRVISGEATIPSGVVYKWWATGTAGTQEFSSYGRKKRHAELKLVMEVPNLTQYNQWESGTSLKVRWRLSGTLIEAALYHYIQMDIYGPFDALDWGEYEGTNRTIALTILSEYNSTAGHDFQVIVQNDRATL
jgi:hypothetical protein